MSQKTKNLLLTWLPRLALLTSLMAITVLVGLSTYLVVRRVTLAYPLNLAGTGPVIQASQATSLPGGNSLPPPPPSLDLSSAEPLNEPSLSPWDGAGRVSVLLLGLDYRDWEADNEASRSDTMILLTIDPLTRTAGILSIPRDTWVAIPGFSHAKINTAYYLGDAHKLPGGGPGLAVKTVEQFLGVPINYYAQIDFGAFVRFIDEIGGVKIDVPEEITIDLLGDGPETIKTLKPGAQVLPGEWALAYARNRKTAEGDFDRARRQQQVILAIRNRLVSADMLLILITKAPVLYQELAAGIRTNLSLEDAVKLALLAKDIPEQNIQRGVIGKEYILFGRSPDNLSINIPIPDKVHLLRDEIFGVSGALGPLTPGDTHSQMVAEGASLAIYNGSRDPELGERTADFLRDQGAHVTLIALADQAYGATLLVDHRGSPYTIKYLADIFGVNSLQIRYAPGANSPAEVELYLGSAAEGVSLP